MGSGECISKEVRSLTLVCSQHRAQDIIYNQMVSSNWASYSRLSGGDEFGGLSQLEATILLVTVTIQCQEESTKVQDSAVPMWLET